MGQSTDGEISFGVVFEDDFQFPWFDETKGYDGDHEEWWQTIKGFKNTGSSYEERRKEREQFYAENPMPFNVVNYCSGEYPMYLLCVPTSNIRCNRGLPTAFNPSDLVVSDEQIKALRDFINEFINDTPLSAEEMKMQWYLTSYWG